MKSKVPIDWVCIHQAAVSSAPIRAETVAKLKVAINGFGRIGRTFLRCWHGRENSPIEVVAVNDSGGVKNVSKGINIQLFFFFPFSTPKRQIEITRIKLQLECIENF